MKTKRILSALMSVVMVFIMFSVLTVLTVTEAPLTAKAATSTETAIFIGDTSGAVTNSIACAMIPLNITPASETWYELSFKCLMLKSGNSTVQSGEPTIGILGQSTNGNSKGKVVGTCPSWAIAYGSSATADRTRHPSFSSGIYKMRFKLPATSSETWLKSETPVSGKGARSFYLTVGNAAYRVSSNLAGENLGCSFIFSNAEIKQCTSETGSTTGSNLLPTWDDSSIDFNGTYFLRSDGGDSAKYDDAPVGAQANKWHVMNMPKYVKKITVPTNYNTASAYTTSGNFTKTAETNFVREYYTNSNYSDLKFAQLANSNGKGFEVIPADVNKKMVIIDANHEGEADVTGWQGSEHTPSLNRSANIFLPICYQQYGVNKYGATGSGNFIAKVSFTAKRLEGSGYPVLGRLTGSPAVRPTSASKAFPAGCYNIQDGSFYSSPSTSNYNLQDGSGNRLTYTYNATTGAFVGWIYVAKGYDGDYVTTCGTSEVITIGNSEHVDKEGKFDSTSFNSSFAISDIQVDLYQASWSGSNVIRGSLAVSDVAPHLYADTLDTTTRWVYQCKSSERYSQTWNDPILASQYSWGAEGCVGMVHTENLTACVKNGHTLTEHAATSTTRRYWSCASCSKNFADNKGIEQITDTSETENVVVLKGNGAGSESVVYPFKLNGFEGNQWFKFTCKVKCLGTETPVVSTLYNAFSGENKCETTISSSNDGDFAVWEQSYDAATGTLTAYIKGWIKAEIYKYVNNTYRYPYERMNAVSGNNCAIVIGNGRYSGNDHTDDNHLTTFAVGEPVLKKISSATTGGSSGLTDAKSKSVTGSNLVNSMTDKTIDLDSSYSTTWDASNNPLSAPAGKWYTIGSHTLVKKAAAPSGFFTDTQTPRMVKIACYQTGSSTVGFSTELFLESETTYQFDMDYRVFGGRTEPNLVFNDAVSDGSMEVVTPTTVPASTTNTHLCYRFTTRSNLRTTSGGNVMIQFGLKWGSCTTSSEYLANLTLRKVSNNSPTGKNLIPNGDFSFGTLGVIQHDTYTERLALFDGANIGFSNGDTQYGYKANELMAIPTNFFNGNAETPSDSTIALKVTPNANNQYLQFITQLDPSAYYRLSFKYNFVNTGTSDNSCTMPVIKRRTCLTTKAYDNSSGVTLTPTSRNSAGSSIITCDFQIPSNATADPVHDHSADGNTDIQIDFGTDASSKVFYITEIKLYKLTGSGGSITGNNLIANMNAILGSSHYTSVGLSSTGNTYNLTTSITDSNFSLGTLKRAQMARNYANGWMVSNSGLNVTLMKVPSNFFDAKTGSTRVSTIRHMILNDGVVTTDNYNPLYNPNGDGTKGDIKDLVHAKRVSVLNSVG